MEIILNDKNGVVLHTAKKYCKEDISVKVQTEELEVTPSTEDQVKEGLINKITIKGDADLIPENIKVGTNIFGVEGGFDAVDTRDATATSNDIIQGTTAYVNNLKVEGSVPNNGELEFEPSDEEQIIPAGMTVGGAVKPADITKLQEYDKCLTLANSIDNLDDYTETTATPEDIRKGKTAYSNGERIEGTMQVSNNNVFIGLTSEGILEDGYNGAIKQVNAAIANYITKIDGVKLKGTCKKTFLGLSSLQEVNIDASQATQLNDLFNIGDVINVNLKKFKLTNTENLTYIYKLLYNCGQVKEVELFNTSNMITFANVFEGSGLISSPQFDLSKATNLMGLFKNCGSLVDVPVFYLSSVTQYINDMFTGCSSLSDESLNNILATCINATKVTNASYKTLKYIGLSSEQTTRCQSLSNYQALLDAGWTTGY